MLMFLLLFLVSCASYENQPITEQNQQAIERNAPERVNRIGPNKR